MTPSMELALVLVRLVEFAAAMLLLGSPALGLALRLHLPAGSPAWRDFERWLRRMLVAASVAALAAAALWLDLEAAIMANGWGAALDPGTVGAVLGDTLFGHAWAWHLGLGAALLAVLAVPLGPDARLSLAALLGAAFVASLAWAGHAVMAPGARHLVVQAVHLLAGGLWLGSLPALFHLLRQARRTRSPALDAALRLLLPLYSRAGYAAVAFVLLTGILNSLFLVGSVADLATTPYGRVLLVKLALVLLMVCVAAANRVALVPALLSARSEARGDLALRALCRSVALEQGAALLVLAAVSLLGTLPPAR